MKLWRPSAARRGGCAKAVLAFEPDNQEAQEFVAAADRASAVSQTLPDGHVAAVEPPAVTDGDDQPASFAKGRYVVKRFLGEGGKKKVYLAHPPRRAAGVNNE